MKFIGTGAAAVVAGTIAWLAASPAVATDFVQDQAGMFSAATVAQLNERIGSFNASTGKAVVVVTTPSSGGASVQSAASNAFAEQHINGVLIFVARDDRRDIILPDRAATQAGWFTPAVTRQIRTAMESQFRAENYDAGITGAVDAVLAVYRSHAAGGQPAAVAGSAARTRWQGVHLPMVDRHRRRKRLLTRTLDSARRFGAALLRRGHAAGRRSARRLRTGLRSGVRVWRIRWRRKLLEGFAQAVSAARGLATNSFAGTGWPTHRSSAATQPLADSGGWQNDAGQADMSGAGVSGDWSGGGFGSDSGGGGDFGGGGGDSGGGW